MEKHISHGLQNYSSVFAVNLKNVAYNYNYIAKKVTNSLIFPAVKANAYGLGVKEISTCLIKEGCKGFFVFTNQEAIEIYPQDKSVTIYTLGGETNNLQLYEEYPNIVPVLYTENQVEKWLANKNHKRFALQLETGLNRQGIKGDYLFKKIDENKNNIKLDMVLTHLACASNPSHAYNEIQLQNFIKVVEKLPKNIKTSLSATYSMFVDDRYNFDIIRPGIALLGGNPVFGQKNEMLPVAHLCGKIIQLRELKKGEKSGYEATVATKNLTLATVSMGYADGVLRVAGKGKCYLNIEGHKAPIFGVVSMDTTTIDVSDVPKNLLYEGAKVEFYGNFTKINDIATLLEENPCNIIIHAGMRAKRIYID